MNAQQISQSPATYGIRHAPFPSVRGACGCVVFLRGKALGATFLQCVTSPRGHTLFRLDSGVCVECAPVGAQWVVQRELSDADIDKLQN